ncbi:MAG: hypothetical protein ACOC9Y_02010 [Chloroflexota bacterium]
MCGYPFTRDLLTDERSAAMVGNWRTARGRDAHYQPHAPPRRRGFLTFLWVMIGLVTVAIVFLLVGVLATNTVLKPMIADDTGDQVEAGLQEAIEEESPSIPESSAEGSGSTGSDEIRITEDDINSRIDQDDLGPLDRMDVSIEPDGVEVDLRAFGVSGTYRSSVQVVDGSVALSNGSISGPLGLVMPTDQIESKTNRAISSALNDVGYHVSQVTLQDDALVIVTEDAAGG